MGVFSIIFALIYLFLFLFNCYQMLTKKRIPSNRYTPFDDLMFGKTPDVKQRKEIQDTKHEIEYEEKTRKDL